MTSYSRSVTPSIACPSCDRMAFTRRDMLYATLDGTARCRYCGHAARLDDMSRLMISLVLAIVLPNVLLYAGVFYSGHLFLVSAFIILGTWGALSWAGFPFLSLEEAPGKSFSMDRRMSLLILGAMLLSAIIIDGYIRTRLD